MNGAFFQLATVLPEWHSASRDFYPSLTFKVSRQVIDRTAHKSNDAFEALLEIEKINDIYVDAELYSSVYIPGAEWETRRARLMGNGENGWYYFVFCPPRTRRHIRFETGWAKDVVFQLRCDLFHIPNEKSPELSEKCLRYIPKRLICRCRCEIKIVPLNLDGEIRQWHPELQAAAEELEQELQGQMGLKVKAHNENENIEGNARREQT